MAAAPGHCYRIERKDGWDWNIRQSDGKKEWNWYPWRSQYSEQPVEPPTDPGNDDPGERFLDFYRQMDKKLGSGRVQPPQIISIDNRRVNCMVIIGPPAPQRRDPTMPAETTYWIDRERKILVKEQLVVRSTVPEHNFVNTLTTTYNLTELNSSIPDSLFRFVPAAGGERVEGFESGPVSLEGKTAPPLKLKTVDGKDFDLESLRGKPVLVDFWATWCVPCRESMPYLAKMSDEFKQRLEVVSVSRDDDPQDAARFFAKYNYSWVNLADPTWESDRKWGESGIPRIVLIAKDGKVLFVSDGFDEKEGLKIRTALHEMDPSFPAADAGK